MAIEPNTKLKLLKCPLTLNNKNQLTFASKEAQYNYFNSLPKIEVEEISYQRKDSLLYFEENIDSLLEYNYCMYQNENYGDKWFYAFIENMRYFADETTEMTLVTDVFQTWQFDITWKQSFIEREMINVADDTIGKNRVPENFETGEYVIKKSYDINDLEFYYIIAYVGDSIKVNGGTAISTPQRGFKYNGIYSSVCFIVCNDTGFNYLMNLMPYEDNSNNILTIFTVPKLAFSIVNLFNENGYHVMNENMSASPSALSNIFDALTTSDTFEGYTPKNKKLYQYPYTYLAFNPINGTKKVFRFEDFNENTPDFVALSEINPNPNVYFLPAHYRRQNNQIFQPCLEDAVSLTGYPTISYKTDVFNTWLAQNGNILSIAMEQENTNFQQQKTNAIVGNTSNAVNTGFNVANGLAGADMPNGGSVVGSYVSGLMNSLSGGINLAFAQKNHELNVKQQMAQIEKQRLLPDNASLSGNNATILGYNYNHKNIFTWYIIKKEFAQKIDKFFDQYGYLTNELKLPNLNNRPNWNYVKTIGANILGNIPQLDLQIIKEMFDAGITLWHNSSTFLDYSQNNR